MASSAFMFGTQSFRRMLRCAIRVSTTRSLSTTTSFAARPRLRPAPRKPSRELLQGTLAEAALPPLSLLISAKKVQILNVEPDRALEILQRYVELFDKNPHGDWETNFCAEENVTPHAITSLGLILGRYRGDANRILGRELIYSASAMGDPVATEIIIQQVLATSSDSKRGHLLDRPEYVRPLANLRKLAAAPYLRVEAMNVLGEVYEFQKQDEKALETYRQATLRPLYPPGHSYFHGTFKGPGYAHVRIGRILLRRSDRTDAEAHFRKAALDFDEPMGYYHLAMLDKSGSEMNETYLLKAASSGILKAATDLGELRLARANSTAVEKKKKVTHAKLAKEWFYLAASMEDPEGMLGLAQAFLDEGNLPSGLKWLEKAEKYPSVAKKATEMRASLYNAPT